VVLLESVGENFIVNLPGSHFQAQQAFMNLLRKSGVVGCFWFHHFVYEGVMNNNKVVNCEITLEL
jgi:hypothetical protein